jgi:hypothetical protein
MKFTGHLLLFLMAVGFLGSGCFPMRNTTSPGVAGIVLDAESRAPITGAKVFVSHAFYHLPLATNDFTGEVEPVAATGTQRLPPSMTEVILNARPPTVITGLDGRFSIPPEKRWGIYIVPMDVSGLYGTLVVRREGYRDVIRFLEPPQSEVNVGEVQMDKQK